MLKIDRRFYEHVTSVGQSLKSRDEKCSFTAMDVRRTYSYIACRTKTNFISWLKNSL